MQDTPASQLSPEALEQKYTDVLSQFRTMMNKDTEPQNSGASEMEPGVEPRPALQQLSPVSKFLHNIQPDGIEPKEAADHGGSETESRMAVSGHHSAEGGTLPHDQSANTKNSRPSPPRFTDDGAYDAVDRNDSHNHTASQQPHIPRQLLQQLAAQQLRIAELEQDIAKEKQQTTEHAAQDHEQQHVVETLQQEVNQYKAAASRAAQQAATLRQDLVIAHAARNDADTRAAACASELTQLKQSQEAEGNLVRQDVSTCTADDDVQQDLAETSALQERLDEAEARCKVASEEASDLRNALKEAMEVNDAVVAREEEAIREQQAATEREATATTRQEEWKRAAEAAAVLAEASIAQANSAKAEAANAQAEIESAKMEAKAAASAAYNCTGPRYSPGVREANGTPHEHGKHVNATSPSIQQPGCSPAKEVRVPASTLRVLKKVQQRLWDRCGREGERVQRAQKETSEATGASPQVKRKRSSRNSARGIPVTNFNVVEALDHVLSHEKQLVERQGEAVQAAESQAAEMSRLQHDFHCSIAHSETLTHRIHTMEAEAAVLRSALVETEARADDAEKLAAAQRVGPHPAELRSTGMQAGLPASIIDHRQGAAGTQTDEEALKDERLRIWKEVEENQSVSSGAQHRQDSRQSRDQTCHERFEPPTRAAGGRYMYGTPSGPQKGPQSDKLGAHDDMSGNVEWVHGKNGCVAFVGHPDVSAPGADVQSTCAQHSPCSPMEGQCSPDHGGFQSNGARVVSGPSSKASAGLQHGQPGRRGHESTGTIEQRSYRGRASKGRGNDAANYGLDYKEYARTPEFEATARTPDNYRSARPSRRRSSSMPPKQWMSKGQRSETVQRDLIREEGIIFTPGNQRQKGTVRMQRGPSSHTQRDRSVPARRPHRQQDYTEEMIDDDYNAHCPSQDEGYRSWTSNPTAQPQGFREVNPPHSPEIGVHRRASSKNRVLSDTTAHVYNAESCPPGFAPDDDDEDGDVRNSLEDGQGAHAPMQQHPPTDSPDTLQPNDSQPPSGHNFDASVAQPPRYQQQKHTQRRSASQHGALASSMDRNQAATQSTSGPNPPAASQLVIARIEDAATDTASKDGFDDGLRDLVARLDEIQRKQAAALAEISESATPDDQKACSGNRDPPIIPDIHSDSAWISGQIGYAYGDGIPTPETVLGLDTSPDPLSPPLHGTHASVEISKVALAQSMPTAAHHRKYVPHATGLMSRSGDLHSSGNSANRGHGDGGKQLSAQERPSVPSQTMQIPGFMDGRTSLPSTLSVDAHPLHHSADWTANAHVPGKHHHHMSLPAHSVATRRPHVSNTQSATLQAHASSLPPAISSRRSESGWRSRVHMRHALNQAEPQHHATAGTPTMQWPSQSPSLSRSASILEVAARQCSDMYASGQLRKSADGSVTDAQAVLPTGADNHINHASSAPASPIPRLRRSIGTPKLQHSHSDIERSIGHYGQQMRSSNSAVLPNQRVAPFSGTSLGTGLGTSYRGMPTRQPPQAPRSTENLRHSGPPQYGALSSAKSMPGTGSYHHASGVQNVVAPLLCKPIEGKVGESNGTAAVRVGEVYSGCVQHRGTDQANQIRPHLSASTWDRLRREHLGRGSLQAESSSDSGSV